MHSYSWIEGKEIVADMLTRQVSRREVLDEIMVGSSLRNALDKKNCLNYRNEEMKVENLTTKIEKT